MGLDSLIPNKNNQSSHGDDDFVGGGTYREWRDDESGANTSRREREDLGVLSSLLSGTHHSVRNDSPFEERRASYDTQYQDTYQRPTSKESVSERSVFVHQDSQREASHDHIEKEVWGEPILNDRNEMSAPSFRESRYNTAPDMERDSVLAQRPMTREKKPEMTTPVFQVELDKIVENPYQPRKEFDPAALDELTASIREFGVLQPLVVTRLNQETDMGTTVMYQLIAGHRRLLASKKAGLRTVPVIIRNNLKRADALEIAIVENIQRENLNVIETARAYARLSDEFGLTQREIAARLGKSREVVANTLRLLSLPTHMQDAVSQGKINESHARILMQIQDPSQQQHVFDQIITEGLSVRDTKRVLARPITSSHTPRTHVAPEVKMMEKDISDVVGAPVHIELSDKGGKIVIHFFSPEEAQGIAQRIKREQGY